MPPGTTRVTLAGRSVVAPCVAAQANAASWKRGMGEAHPRNVVGRRPFPRGLDRLPVRVELQGANLDRAGLRQQIIDAQLAHVAPRPTAR